VARGHSRTKDGSDAPQDFQAGARVPFEHLLGRCAVFIALKHGQQSQPRSSQHGFASENFGITGNEALKLLFDCWHILILVVTGWFVQTAHAGEIVQKPLDEFVIYNLPIAFKSGNTTVLFPSTISALYAKSVAVQEQANADFLISFTPGSYHFTIRALRPEAKDHLTVIYNRKAYVLRLSASEKPFYTVTFFQDAGPRGLTRPVVPERLLSLIDKAKAYPLFQNGYPDALAGVLHAAPNTVNYYDNFKLWIRDVWRFEQEDTLIFHIHLENTSDGAIYYKPQDLAVRLEDRIYTQSIADASGVMPPKSVTPAFFAITGNGDGGRNNLVPDNKWNVLVVRAGGQPQLEGLK
jgi:hypothetical protein